jgi:Kef-type K+ transport system membrane component KefB
MSYVRKNSGKVFGSITAIIVVAGLAAWQFYRFVTFTNAQGSVDLQGGRAHLWWAIAMAVCACVAAFFVFTIFLRHDTDDELHITS